MVRGESVGLDEHWIGGKGSVGVFEVLEDDIVSGGTNRQSSVLYLISKSCSQKRIGRFTHVQPDNKFFASTNFTSYLLVCEVQTGLVVGRVGSCAGELLACCCELVWRAEATVGMTGLNRMVGGLSKHEKIGGDIHRGACLHKNGRALAVLTATVQRVHGRQMVRHTWK